MISKSFEEKLVERNKTISLLSNAVYERNVEVENIKKDFRSFYKHIMSMDVSKPSMLLILEKRAQYIKVFFCIFCFK
jgi:uncharacterized coiled-coil protein SlyX